MLGKQSIHAAECFADNFIGADFGITQNLNDHLYEDGRTFNVKFIPIFLANNPDKTKIAAGLACSALWNVSKGIKNGDVVLCPDGNGVYHLGEVVGDYCYRADEILPHRRQVRWAQQTIPRENMSESLRNSTGSLGTISCITKYHEEIEKLMKRTSSSFSDDDTTENPTAFALEAHFEDFLIKNWAQTELGQDYDLFQDEEGQLGKQYPTDTGPMDILAVSKDRKTLLVIELKKGRSSDATVGQTLRYMGYVKEVLAEPDQETKGVIIALEDDLRIQRALQATPNISFYRYQISFKLVKV